MEKWLCWGSLGVAAVLALVFLLDLLVGVPFASAVPEDGGQPFLLVDIAGLLGSGIVAFLAYSAIRDLK